MAFYEVRFGALTLRFGALRSEHGGRYHAAGILKRDDRPMSGNRVSSIVHPRLGHATVLASFAASALLAGLAAHAADFVLTSPDSRLVTSVPLKYTAKAFGCSGGNVSPALAWQGAPAGTRSFVLTLFDPDERSTPSGWWHWIVYNLPAGTDHLSEGTGAINTTSLPAGTLQGRSDLGEDAYHGPCPAEGDPPHRYVFTVYALNVEKLPVAAHSSGGMVTSVVQDHLLGKAVFIAHYGRPNAAKKP
jgi:Raf kinase inhibitor-like YbhB/YbcL family protein